MRIVQKYVSRLSSLKDRSVICVGREDSSCGEAHGGRGGKSILNKKKAGPHS